MINPELERFAKDVAGNEALRNELKAIGTNNPAIVRFANSKGYDFSIEQVEQLAKGGEISDQALKNVAGGINIIGSGDKYLFAGGASRIFNW